MSFRTQLQDTRANAQGRIIGNKHRKGLETSRADVCWNGRRPCEPEFNYMIREKAVRNESLDQTNASIVKNDVRMVWEVDVVSAFSSSNA